MKNLNWLYKMLVLLLFSAACNMGSTLGTELPVAPSIEPAAETTPAITNPVLAISGEEEVVFDWTTDRCTEWHVPDLPTRAFRSADGQVRLIISHDTSRLMVGLDLNTLSVECGAVLSSHANADPSLFSDYEWLGPVYTEDGETVYALVHNEHHGNLHGSCASNDWWSCWYNTITMAVSTDGGKSFALAAEPPDHFVAGLPVRFEAGKGPIGLRTPTNIIKGKDGYYYSFLSAAGPGSSEQWVCLMRSDNLADPKSWRFWDGVKFEGRFINPYLESPANPDDHECAALALDAIGSALHDSITYNTFLDRYVLIGISADFLAGRNVWGFFYSISDNLVTWPRRKLLMEMPITSQVANAITDLWFAYPTLLDPDSDSRNFETADDTAYLYYTRHNPGQNHADRDLIRVPVRFFRSWEDANAAQP